MCIYTEMIMTTFDVIGAVELTMSAAIAVAALSILAGHNAVQRIRYSAILAAWFVIVVILAATEALGNEHGTGAPGLGIAVACADRVDVHRADVRAVATVSV